MSFGGDERGPGGALAAPGRKSQRGRSKMSLIGGRGPGPAIAASSAFGGGREEGFGVVVSVVGVGTRGTLGWVAFENRCWAS